MEQLGSHWTDFHEIWYEYFSKISQGSLFRYYLTRITDTLHEDLFTFMMSGCIILMRNVLDKRRRENQNILCSIMYFS